VPVVVGVNVVVVPPVSSVVKGPRVEFVPSGAVTVTVKPDHLSPYGPLAVGGGRSSQNPTVTVCPTPVGSGPTCTYDHVWMVDGEVIELALGISIIEAGIDSTKNIEMAIAIILFFRVFIFLFSPIFLFCVRRSREDASSQQYASLNSSYK
jgi:hypothetical protein